MNKQQIHLLSGALLSALILLSSCRQSPEDPRIHPEWSYNATIYEVNIRQFTPEGTFRALEDHLPRLHRMGIRILWLMPIHPIGQENRKGSLGSYYSVKDYFDVNPEFGTREDFRRLVEKIHELGMYVIIDWVANHTAWDNPLTGEHPEWYLKDSLGSIVPPVADWSDVAGLDYTQPALWDYMSDALEYWVEEFKIDGYRCDVAGMLPVAFWNRVVPELKQHRELFMLAEWETPDMHDTAFDATYSWDFYHLMNQLARQEKPVGELDTLLKKERATYPPHAFRMRFISNHDENSWNGTEFERLGEAAGAFTVLTFTVPGIPLVYTGQEAAQEKRLSFFEKDTIAWQDFPLSDFYSTLIHLKLNHRALDAGEGGADLLHVATSRDSTIYAFLRRASNDRILVILNLSPLDQTFELRGDDFPGTYTETFSGAAAELTSGYSMKLGPWGYRVYTRE